MGGAVVDVSVDCSLGCSMGLRVKDARVVGRMEDMLMGW
jgi:hypothetical protein